MDKQTQETLTANLAHLARRADVEAEKLAQESGKGPGQLSAPEVWHGRADRYREAQADVQQMVLDAGEGMEEGLDYQNWKPYPFFGILDDGNLERIAGAILAGAVIAFGVTVLLAAVVW